MKTKKLHWHVTGSHFRDYNLLLDEQADQVLGIADLLAERSSKLGETTILPSARSPASSGLPTTIGRSSSRQSCSRS